MPKRLERLLKIEAKRRGLRPRSKRYKAYVYGTLAKVKARKGGKDGGQ